MNPVWIVSTRASCLHPRSVLRPCLNIDSLTARLAQTSIWTHSVSSVPVKSKETRLGGQRATKPWQYSNAAFRLPVAIRSFATQRIIRHFDSLPVDYMDEDGLKFRIKDLSREETHAVFGKKMIDPDTANRMLRVLHGRRVAGTLGDPSYTSSTYEAKAIETGLKWLRKNVPVNEIECAGLRAEKELAEMEQDIVSDTERLGLYQPNSGGGNVYGDSVIDQVRRAKEAKLDVKEKAKKERLSQADEIRQNTGTLQTIRPQSQVELRRPGENPRLKYYIERAKVAPDTPPEMTKWERLWPSGLLALAVIVGSVIFTTVYTPPRRESRAWPDMPPSAATVISIILLNTIILGAWRIPPAFRVLNKYFLALPGYPRALAVIGNIFSHQTIGHFSVNMVVLWFVGVRLHDEIGRANFIAIYLSAGVFASFVSLASWVLRNNFVTSSLGASGAICGLVATYLLLNSDDKVTLFGVFPPKDWPSISSLMLLGLMVSTDVFAVWKGRKVTMIAVDHWAHLGGYAAGAAAGGVIRRQQREKKERERERRERIWVL
ncbi:hypothetical protein ONS95_009706 [Cadophora gregata]|uniref:uncharacterized protein n=1 Tax=Cadophora gregata TaxID=51156 RepID=UPI0026DC060B|nr:uncharacterized protein ONS95_009706 [Cadophora gregata]KAK0121412.1 hypothetical protein ONS95_009706 [Cadophora gregata]